MSVLFDTALALARAETSNGRFPRHTNTDPLRAVTTSSLHEGRVNIIAGFYGRWYDLVLDCGHTVERPAHAKAPPGERMPRGYGRQHHGVPHSWIQPAPKRVRCELCAREVRLAAKRSKP